MIYKVKKCGNSGHMIVPKKYIGQEIEIKFAESDDSYLTKKQVKALIESTIYEINHGC